MSTILKPWQYRPTAGGDIFTASGRKKIAKGRVLETGKSYTVELRQTERSAVLTALAQGCEIEPGKVASWAGLSTVRYADGVLRQLANSGHPAVKPCRTCRLYGGDEECQRCSEVNHSACLGEVGGVAVCRECVAVMEGGK